MAWLAPLFLLGIAAVALPFWLHRLQTESSDRKSFSSAMLLEQAEQRVHVQKKLKYLLLLALRVLLLCLLALAFAKPILRKPPVPVVASAAGSHLIVVDTSASIGRAGGFVQAQNEALRAVSDASPDALLQVVAADGGANQVSAATFDRSQARTEINALGVGTMRLDFGVLMQSLEAVIVALPAPVTLEFISDFQASGMPVRFVDVVPSGVARFVPRVVGTGAPFNWSISEMHETRDGIEVILNGAGDRERMGDIDLILNDVVVASQGLSQTGPHSVRFNTPEWETGDNRLSARVISDDDFAADNAWHEVINRAPPSPVPVLTRDATGLPMIYLSAALESSGRFRVDPQNVAEFDVRTLSRHRWIVVDDLGIVDIALAEALDAFIREGGRLLAFAGEQAEGLETLPVIGHSQRGFATDNIANLGIADVERSHPILASTEGWPGVNVGRHVAVESGADDEVLARLESGQPFLLEGAIGRGSWMLVAAPLDNRWTDFPQKPVFVSFMIEAATYLSGSNHVGRQYLTGSLLPLALLGDTSGQVVDPDGQTILSLADTTREQQIRLEKPGFYEVYTREGEALVAANIDPRESDLRVVEQRVLDDWQAAVAGGAADSVAASLGPREETVVELWHLLLLMLALAVIAESILGNAHMAPRARKLT